MEKVIDKMKYSPMLRQYIDMKEENPDIILFYRVGDFYEMFFEDAIIASKVLEITLTGKDAGTNERVPMCGVPFHAVNTYLQKMINSGFKVAIVEQIKNEENKKLMKREIVRIVSPGTNMELESSNTNNFIVSLEYSKANKSNSSSDRFIISYLDITTGEGYLTSFPAVFSMLSFEIKKLHAKEIVIKNNTSKALLEYLESLNVMISYEDNDELPSFYKRLTIDLDRDETICYARCLNYIIRTQKRTLVHLQIVAKYDIDSYMKIDLSSQRNLELLETLRFQDKQNSLINVLDKTSTAMGRRFLRKSIIFPLIEKNIIEKRYDIIDSLREEFIYTEDLKKYLSSIYDLERIVGKISYENANPHDLLQLKKSLHNVGSIKKIIKKINLNKEIDFDKYLKEYQEIFLLIDNAISIDAPINLKDGGVIKKGYSEELDKERNITLNNKDFILSLENKEKEKTGIKILKIGYNRVFGYYIEVTKSQLHLIKDEFGYIRKQTTSNSERYITQELKDIERIILRSKERQEKLEFSLFKEVKDKCREYTFIMQDLSKKIAFLDMMVCFSYISKKNKYVRPVITSGKLEIISGRHPVLEESIKDKYIPNDAHLDDDKFFNIITGPNMSGKSTYMRQIALIAIMAQIGCFVPAKKASLPIFDKVFTRIGASDDISRGESTFMVEMNEVNNALSGATANSLILFDEIGRGTATFDGMALAQSIIEYIHENIKCKTLFSTHYHELTTLEKSLNHIENIYVSAALENGDLVFLHKIKKGAVSQSYGINVAKLANIPDEVIIRAKDILSKLDSGNHYDIDKLSKDNYVAPLIYDSKSSQESYVIDKIKKTNLFELSPIEALNLLDELKKKL